MAKRQIRFKPEYLNEEGKWISLQPKTMDLKADTDYNFFIQDIDKNTELSYSEKISLKLNTKIEKQE